MPGDAIKKTVDVFAVLFAVASAFFAGYWRGRNDEQRLQLRWVDRMIAKYHARGDTDAG